MHTIKKGGCNQRTAVLGSKDVPIDTETGYVGPQANHRLVVHADTKFERAKEGEGDVRNVVRRDECLGTELLVSQLKYGLVFIEPKLTAQTCRPVER